MTFGVCASIFTPPFYVMNLDFAFSCIAVPGASDRCGPYNNVMTNSFMFSAYFKLRLIVYCRKSGPHVRPAGEGRCTSGGCGRTVRSRVICLNFLWVRVRLNRPHCLWQNEGQYFFLARDWGPRRNIEDY